MASPGIYILICNVHHSHRTIKRRACPFDSNLESRGSFLKVGRFDRKTSIISMAHDCRLLGRVCGNQELKALRDGYLSIFSVKPLFRRKVLINIYYRYVKGTSLTSASTPRPANRIRLWYVAMADLRAEIPFAPPD